MEGMAPEGAMGDFMGAMSTMTHDTPTESSGASARARAPSSRAG